MIRAVRSEPWLVIPVKPPVGSKQRLSAHLGDSERGLLSGSLAARVVSLAARGWPARRLLVVGAGAELERLCGRLGVEVLGEAGAGQSAAVRAGAQRCLEQGASTVATLSSDLPELDIEDVHLLLRVSRRLLPGSVVLFPDRSGAGTNGLVANPGAILLQAFGADSRARHQRLAEAMGMRCRCLQVAGIAADLDRPDDLERAGAASRPFLGRLGKAPEVRRGSRGQGGAPVA